MCSRDFSTLITGWPSLCDVVDPSSWERFFCVCAEVFGNRAARSSLVLRPPFAPFEQLLHAVSLAGCGERYTGPVSDVPSAMQCLGEALIGRLVVGGWPHAVEGVVFEVSCAEGVVRFSNPSCNVSHMEASKAAFHAGSCVKTVTLACAV
jgi:hypothetical protein